MQEIMVKPMESTEEKNLQQKKKELLEKKAGSKTEETTKDSPVHLDVQSFHELIENAEKPVFVDFWAPWCAPCKMTEPIVEDLAEEFAGEVIVGKLNLEEGNNRRVAEEYQVHGIPTFIILKNGKPVERITGARSKQNFKRLLTKHS